MSKEEDEKKLESLTDRLVNLMDKIYKAQKELNEVEDEAAELLRRLVNRNWDGQDKR